MACEVHHLTGVAHQSELDAPLALNCLLVVKVLMGDHFFLPSFLSPSRTLFF
jgi:hypothetical protein